MKKKIFDEKKERPHVTLIDRPNVRTHHVLPCVDVSLGQLNDGWQSQQSTRPRVLMQLALGSIGTERCQRGRGGKRKRKRTKLALLHFLPGTLAAARLKGIKGKKMTQWAYENVY